MQKEIKYNGFTATPSDYECPDGDLAALINLVPEDGQLKPIFPATQLFTLPDGYKPIFIHKTAAFTHYIIRHDDTSTDPPTIQLYWIDEPDSYKEYTDADFIDSGQQGINLLHTFGTINEINSIGNTLIVLSDDGMHYLLWKEGAYNYLGTHLPEIEMMFGLSSTIYTGAFIDTGRIDFTNGKIKESEIDALNEVVYAKINKVYAEEILEEGKFAHPFFVRYAYRLYDGQTLTMHSAPILLKDFNISLRDEAGSATIPDPINDPNTGYTDPSHYSYIKLQKSVLSYYIGRQINVDKINDWKDIIQSVDVFISAPLYLYDQNKKIEEVTVFEDTFHGDTVFGIDFILPDSDQESMNNRIKENSQFYLIDSISVSELSTNPRTPDLTDKLKTLVNKEVMTDDYDSHDLLVPQFSYIYNQRLNIANINKLIFGGFTPKQLNMQWGDSKITTAITYNIDGRTMVARQSDENVPSTALDYIYYYNPNANAIKISIVKEVEGVVSYGNFELKQHSFLQGTYAIIDNEGWTISAETYEQTKANTAKIPAATNMELPLPNKIYTSEVNNPFYFPVKGINTIGTGEIKGICAAVKAMSQGQYGQFPLYAFTDEGVWTLEVAKDGTFGEIPPPVTRDVCINHYSITQLDSTVLFATNRGIMMLSGSSSICISEVLDSINPFTIEQLPNSYAIAGLNGFNVFDFNYAPFRQYIKECRMIYDYTNQRIIVFNPSTETVGEVTRRRYSYAYVYSLKSKQWGMMKAYLNDNINSYPDALAYTDTNTVINLSDPDDNAILQGLKGMLITRPLKLDAPDVLKTIDTIIQRGYFRKGGVSCVLLGSRDLFNWQIIYSANDHYLRGFRGTPYKYFRIVIYCDMQKDESLFGCTVQYTPRLTDQPR